MAHPGRIERRGCSKAEEIVVAIFIGVGEAVLWRLQKSGEGSAGRGCPFEDQIRLDISNKAKITTMLMMRCFIDMYLDVAC